MELSDEYLMSKVRKDDPDLLNVIYKRYSARIYSYFLKSTLVKADSEDLTQELFLRVLRYRHSYKDGHPVELWIFQIARNLLKDHYNKAKVQRDRLDTIFAQSVNTDIADAEGLEKEKQLYNAMSCLPHEKRELLVLSKFEGLKYEQIAKMRDTSVSNIKVQVHRIIKELREIYFEKEKHN